MTHAELERDGATVMLATPTAEYQGPRRHRETCEAARRWQDNPWVIDGLLVEVDDVDAHHAQAVAGGAVVIRPLEDVEGAGMRLYAAEDLEGHRWMFGQPLAPPRRDRGYPRSVTGAYLLDLPGARPYDEALALQRSLAGAVSQRRSRTR